LQLNVVGSFGGSPFNFSVQLDLSISIANLAQTLFDAIVAHIKTLLQIG
jgi:hypothetical protein